MSNQSFTDCSPLSQACIKALTDKLEEKRKFAAAEIEKMTAEFSMSNNFTMINRLIIVVSKFCLSSTPNTRKGGLLGLAAVMVGFKNGAVADPPKEIVEEVVRPILTCFKDPDPKVRYYATESLYNVTKVAGPSIMPLFDCLFDNMSKIVADTDIGVRGGAEALDRLVKDIVVEQQEFDLQSFMDRFEEYIFTNNSFTRMFLISWIRLLDSKINLIDKNFSKLLDGVLNCLYDTAEEIRASTLALLSEFLSKIVVCPTDRIDINSIVKVLLKYAKNDKVDIVQYTAIVWLRQFISLMDDKELITFSQGILEAILPCLALRATPEGSLSSYGRFIPQSPSRGNVCEVSSQVNLSLLKQVTEVLTRHRNVFGADSASSNLDPILRVLVKELQEQDHPVIKLAVLDWLKGLKSAEPDLLFENDLQAELFQILLETISVRSDAVVKNALQVVVDLFCLESTSSQEQIASSDAEVAARETPDTDRRKPPVKVHPGGLKAPSKKVAISTGDTQQTQRSTTNLDRFIQALYDTFRKKEAVFSERGTFIVLNLCSVVKPEMIYRSFADILKDEKADVKFAFVLVQKLNQILLTTQPLSGLRIRLSSDNDAEMKALFQSLHQAWRHSPIAALTLCLLTNNYKHANEIVVTLAQTDINLDILTQIDWVVQLIESPVFASLRMKLLDVNSNQYLLQSLYGLLMILPQSDAYRRLSDRLDQVHKFMSVQPHIKASHSIGSTSKRDNI